MIKILVVEDEVKSREALVNRLRNLLKEEGLIETAENGNQAIQKALEVQPALILMDIEMPLMNGLDAASVIAKHLPETDIVFLPAYNSFDYAVEAIRVGSRDYLLKPVSENDLRELLRKYTGEVIVEHREKDTPFASALYAWLRSHYTQEVALEDAATSMGMSGAYFSRKVKAETGRTFLDHLTSIRMDNAKRRLTTTDMSVADIGRAVGYADANYFVKAFKRTEGITPGEYRASAQQ